VVIRSEVVRVRVLLVVVDGACGVREVDRWR
jgi:hypothetical protein